MLVEFTVENFLSFKERVTFSMEATKDDSLDKNIIDLNSKKKERLLKMAAIYGPNASGKSNLIRAIDFVILGVQTSQSAPPGINISVIPFKLDRKNVDKPSNFEIVFIQKGIKYIYGFSLVPDRVIKEYLHYYPGNKLSKIFERNNTTEFKFNIDKTIQKSYVDKTGPTVLYLSRSAQLNYEKTLKAYEWFRNFAVIKPRFRDPSWVGFTADQIEKNTGLKDGILDILRKSDLGILDINVHEKPIKDQNGFNNLPEDIKKKLMDQEIFEIKIFHKGKDKKGETTTEIFDISEESDGTKQVFEIIGPLMDVIAQEKVIIIDELESHLHPHLVKNLLNLIWNSKNKNCQLIFTTHQTFLLDQDLLRKDQVWFTEKKEDGSTNLFSLAEYIVPSDANVEKRYHAGRYGAIPKLLEGLIL